MQIPIEHTLLTMITRERSRAMAQNGGSLSPVRGAIFGAGTFFCYFIFLLMKRKVNSRRTLAPPRIMRKPLQKPIKL